MSVQDYFTRYNNLRGLELQKDELIQELLRQVEGLSNEVDQWKLDHDRETQFNRESQNREKQFKQDVDKLQRALQRNPFVLVLIDGDGMIFNDELVKLGESGGRQAAGLLWKELEQHIQNMSLPTETKIVVRIYANLKGLGEICSRVGIVPRQDVLEDFARGFTGSKQLFDYIDVGMGKDRADDKLTEIFKLHLHNCHCRHIFFGGSHDNGYARLLEDITDEFDISSITLLEGVPFERELRGLKSKYNTMRFEGLFREQKISSLETILRAPLSVLPNGASQNGSVLSNHAQHASLENGPAIQNGGVPLTSSPPPATATWASTARTASGRISTPPPPASEQPPKYPQILRNRYGQRIDPVITYNSTDLVRIKKLKLCNVHFLRSECPYDPCTHEHSYKPTQSELQTLKYLGRLIPCRNGSDCDDPKCIYGHRCPNDTEGSKECYYGENCKFNRQLHGIDRTPVKTFKVGGKS